MNRGKGRAPWKQKRIHQEDGVTTSSVFIASLRGRGSCTGKGEGVDDRHLYKEKRGKGFSGRKRRGLRDKKKEPEGGEPSSAGKRGGGKQNEEGAPIKERGKDRDRKGTKGSPG